MSSVPVVPAPVPPTDIERSVHYHGVAGTLLARTSTVPHLPRDTWGIRNVFRPIGPHTILSAWSDELVRSIQDTLDGLPWHRFYPIRLGIRPILLDSRPSEHTDDLILMVDVVPGAAGFEPAITAALACRHLLNKAGVSDIEVEIREVRPRLFVSLDDLQPVIEKRYWAPSPDMEAFHGSSLNDEFVNMLGGFVGLEIAPEEEPGIRAGTMGPFLRLAGRDSELYGLTCRHVAHRPVENPGDVTKPWFWLPNDQGYNHETAATPGNHRMIQPGRGAVQDFGYHLDKCCKVVEEQRKDRDRARTKHFMQGTDLPWPGQSEYDDLERDLAYYRKFQDFLKQADEDALEPRPFGQIAFMPPLEVSNRGFMRDWALIRLNQVTAGPARSNSVVAGQAAGRFSHEVVADTQPRSVMLKGIWSSDKIHQRQSVKVAKRGKKTGFTFGVTNEIKAVVRTVGLGETVGWEWIVIHEKDNDNFSQPGDSGACVFDMNGEVVGLVTSGGTAGTVLRRWKRYTEQDEALPVDSGAKESGPVPSKFKDDRSGTDLTFVTPIDKVLEDIEKVTGCKPSLA